jgi:hypothetical protein
LLRVLQVSRVVLGFLLMIKENLLLSVLDCRWEPILSLVTESKDSSGFAGPDEQSCAGISPHDKRKNLLLSALDCRWKPVLS